VDDAAFDRLCRSVYIAARANTVDCTDAFDLAAEAMALRPRDPDAAELASLSVDCLPASRPRMATVALRLLDTVGFDAGFAEEPAWLARLEDAVRRVNRDVAASGLPHGCALRVHDDQPGLAGTAQVATWDGHTGSTPGIHPAAGAHEVSALVEVADDAQDAMMHALWAAWPVCPVHRLGVHAEEHDEAAVWWCAGDDGHAVAAVGEWPGR
jgi:hypothetical protein